IPEGGEGVITVKADTAIKSSIVLGNKTVTIVDNGSPVVITDKLSEPEGPNFMFVIYGTAKVYVKATAPGNITFQGAGKSAANTSRCMFNVGPQNGDYGDKSTAAVLEMTNVTVQGISTTYTGGVARGYGTMTFTDCVIRDNETTVNGTFLCMYGKVTINGGEFTNNSNTFSNGGLIQVTNTDGCELTVNGGYFAGNSGVWGAAINTYAKSKLTIDGATFENNAALDAEGAAVRTQGTTVIRNSTFKGNSPYDITVKGGNATIDQSVSASKIFK
ncbi:MAG: hypothetical protein IKT95_00195, partial [Spirochaetales bacterium]|nr:hypothetical protein [Spirochaetales bacterium]